MTTTTTYKEVMPAQTSYLGTRSEQWSRPPLGGFSQHVLSLSHYQVKSEVTEMLYLCDYRLEEVPSGTAPGKRKLCVLCSPPTFDEEAERFYVDAYEPDVSWLCLHNWLEHRLDLLGKTARARRLAADLDHSYRIMKTQVGESLVLQAIIINHRGKEVASKGAGCRPQMMQNVIDLLEGWEASGGTEWGGAGTQDPLSAHVRGRARARAAR